MKALLGKMLIYVLPGFVVLGAFIGGHAAVGPRADHLQPFRDRTAQLLPEAEVTAPDAAVAAAAVAGGAPAASAATAATALGAAAVPAEGAPAEGAADAAAPDAAADARIQRDEQGNIIPPRYRYFSFSTPFAGNAREGAGMYSIELSVNVFMPPMFADVVILRLQENEMKLRGAVMDVLADVAAEDLRDVASRAELVARIRDAMNARLVSEGFEPDIREVVITSFVIT
jgi:hypothetical protein